MTVSFGVSLFCGCGRVGVCWILGVGVWVGGLVVGAWGVAAELHSAGCMIVYCIHHHWESRSVCIIKLRLTWGCLRCGSLDVSTFDKAFGILYFLMS